MTTILTKKIGTTESYTSQKNIWNTKLYICECINIEFWWCERIIKQVKQTEIVSR